MDTLSLLLPAILFGLVSFGLKSGYKNAALYFIALVALSQWYYVLLGGAGPYMMAMPSMLLKSVLLWASVVTFLVYTGRYRAACWISHAIIIYNVATVILVKYFGFTFNWLPVLMQ